MASAGTGTGRSEVPVDQNALQRSVQELLARVDAVRPAGSQPVSEGLKAVIGAAERILGVDCVGILLLDEDDRLRSVASSDSIGAALDQAQQDMGEGPYVDSVRTASTVAVVDLQAAGDHAGLAAQIDRLGVRAAVSAPVWVNGAVAGNLTAMHRGSHEWRADEIAATETFADVIAAFLQISVAPDRQRRGAAS